MKRKLFTVTKYLTALALFFCITGSAFAEHTLGGSVEYTYLGFDQETGLYSYRATFITYVDRNSNNYPGGVQPSIYYGVYDAGTLERLSFDITDVTELRDLSAVLPPDCNFTAFEDYGVTENRYEILLELPANEGGYYLFQERCCRSSIVDNLALSEATGNIYYTYIPPAPITNSTPVSTENISFVACANEPYFVNTSMFDPDGDSLVYSFEQPFNTFDVIPAPAPPLVFPGVESFPRTDYEANYSLENPFGPNSYARVDANGITEYYSEQLGINVVNMRVDEYRQIGGEYVLINSHYREIQLLVTDCPVNTVPELAISDSSRVSNDTLYFMQGEEACFDFMLDSVDLDTVSIDLYGSILDGSDGYNGSLASFARQEGSGQVMASFCWDPGCNVGEFPVTIEINDRGCPPKQQFINLLFVVEEVPPPVPADTLFMVCRGEAFALSVTPSEPGAIVEWYADSLMNTLLGTGSAYTLPYANADEVSLWVREVENGCGSIPQQLTVAYYQNTVDIPAEIACVGDSVAVQVSDTTGTATFQWLLDGVPIEGADRPTIVPAAPGEYTMVSRISEYCEVASQVITVFPTPSAPEAEGVSICTGTAATLQAEGEGELTWYADEALTQLLHVGNTFNTEVLEEDANFWVRGETEHCQGDATEVTVSVENIEYTFSQSHYCEGETISFDALTADVGVEWYREGELLTGQSGNELSGVEPGVYRASLTLGGCVISTQEMVVHPRPEQPTVVAPQSVCSDDTVTLSALEQPGVTFAWYANSGLTEELHTGEEFTLGNLGSTTTFWVVPRTEWCAGDPTEVTVGVVDPVADYQADITSGMLPLTVNFQNLSQGASTYLWDFGNGQNSQEEAPTVTFTEAGEYTITLTAYASENCFDVVESLVIWVVPDVEIPNAISPNGDGVNDRWIIGNIEAFPQSAVSIFNQWGAEVFRSTGYTNDWDGDNLPDGTYFYLIELGEAAGNRQGYITIKRQ